MSLSERDCDKIRKIVKAEIAPIHQALFGTEEDEKSGLAFLIHKHEEELPALKISNKIAVFFGGAIALTLVGILFKVIFHF